MILKDLLISQIMLKRQEEQGGQQHNQICQSTRALLIRSIILTLELCFNKIIITDTIITPRHHIIS